MAGLLFLSVTCGSGEMPPCCPGDRCDHFLCQRFRFLASKNENADENRFSVRQDDDADIVERHSLPAVKRQRGTGFVNQRSTAWQTAS